MGIVLAFILGIAGSVIAAEFFAWLPCLRKALLAIAIYCVPKHYKSRLAEEWESHLDEIPGELIKTLVAADFIRSGLVLNASSWCTWNALVWRTTNVVMGVCAALWLGPILISSSMALLVLDGQIFDRRIRIGEGGKAFYLYKFMTIKWNGSEWKETKIGALLYRTRLDEIPQLINVMKGDMTLVGPRARSRISLHELGPLGRNLYLDTKPGLVSAASFELFSRRNSAEIEYLESRTLAGDFRILLKTPFYLMGLFEQK